MRITEAALNQEITNLTAIVERAEDRARVRAIQKQASDYRDQAAEREAEGLPELSGSELAGGDAMTTKHTPGPWKVIKGDGVFYVTKENDSEGGVIVADTTDESAARLIAKAPEMYALLRVMFGLAQIGNLDSQANAHFERVERLLAEIEGGQ